MNLTRLCIQRPVLLVVVLAAIFVLGFKALSGMPTELDPKVELPIINVMTIYPGAGPEEMEQRVTRPIEDAAATVSNVESVDSRSLQDVSFVTVRMKLGTNIDAVAADLRARMDAIRRDLPEDVETPQISKFDFNARPVMVLGVTGDRPLKELRRLVDEEIRPVLSGVPGLGNVGVVGGLRREVQIRVDPDRLAQNGLSLLDLLRPLQASSRSAPAGSVDQGSREVSVRVLGEYRSLEELRNTAIPPSQSAAAQMQMQMMGGMGGAPRGPKSAVLRLGDFAEVSDTTAERVQITRVGERESIGLVLSRLSEANTVRVAEGVRHALEGVKAKLPADVRITVLQDNSTRVADALEDINATLILGAILAVVVVFLFLHSLKDTLIVAVSIPICIVATFIVMYFAGFSMNQMTMLALSLSVGILVDDSILVLECIHRHRAMGKAPQEAALDGRQEIGLADAANTFVDVVVFIPIAFMAGVVGQFFKEFGLTIAAATLFSLYVSFTVTPTLAARWFRAGEAVEPPRGRFGRWFDRTYEALETGYRGSLSWALRRRGIVALLGFGSLFAVGALAWQVLGFDFTPSVDRGEVGIRVELPPGSSLQATDRLVQRIEAEAAKIPEVDSHRMLASVGEIIGGFGSTPDRGPQFGQITLMLMEKQGFVDKLLHPGGQAGRRTRSDEEVAADLRARLKEIPGAEAATVSAMRGFTSATAPVQVSLFGNDLEELQRVSEEVRRRMATVPQLQNVDSTLRPGKPEIQVVYNREKAEDLFVTPAELSGVLRTAIAGNTDLRYRDGDQTVPIRLLVQRSGQANPARGQEALGSLLVARRGPTDVYVSDVADFRTASGPTRIMRSKRERRVSITADLRGVSLGEAQRAVDAALQDVDMGGVRLRWEGEVDEMSESAVSMASAIGLAIALSYLLLAAVFNSLVLPLAIMVSVPMALVGGLLGLIYTGTTMNIISMIGIVMLVGLVSKNAILLVDYTNTLREKGLSRTAALESAGPVRLRPILMTTVSTVLAMTPVALQIGRASELRSPMAIVVIGGLILSTLLTLLVVPVMYTYFDDMSAGIQRGWARMFPQRVAAEETPPDSVPAAGRSQE